MLSRVVLATGLGAVAIPGFGAGGIGGTGITAYGPVQRFGSIFVAGGEYHLRGAAILIDGRPATRAGLHLGQVVLVHGHARGKQLVAESVQVRHAVIGPIGALDRHRITVLGQTVSVPTGFYFHGSQGMRPWAQLTPGDVVRVSALPEANGSWSAVRIERVYRAAQAPAVYPILVRGVARRGGGALILGTTHFLVPRGAHPARGGPVVLRGEERDHQVIVRSVRPDALSLGRPGTHVVMSGYLSRRAGAWHVDQVAVRFAAPPRSAPRGPVVIEGTVDHAGEVRVESLDLHVPPAPETRRHGPDRQDAGHAHGNTQRPELESPDMARPEVEIPSVTRPDIERPEMDR